MGTTAAEVRQRYKVLVVRLHPDKCKVEGAAEAFDRVRKAFSSVSASLEVS